MREGITRREFAAAGCVTILGPTVMSEGNKRLRALILSGRNNHDWRSTTPFLRKALESTGRFDVRVNEEPAGLTARTLSGYDVLVLDYNGPRWGMEAEAAVTHFVRAGKGLVAVHGASYAFSGLEILGDAHVPTGVREAPWHEYADMIGATWVEGAGKTGHGRRHVFTTRFVDSAHPIAAGMGETFLANDELYHRLKFRPGARVLATAHDDVETGGTGHDEPVLWTVSFGSGRVFHTALGHDVAAMQMPGFVSTFARGAEWAAAGAVTIRPEIALEARAAGAVRVLVVTGGHFHDPSFYSLFEGYPDIVATVDPHPTAYARELRRKFDVLALYDLTQDIPENQRQNLRNFVESGKGVVVLHHATADFNNWDWWHREVVGGRYVLNAEGGRPASTYRLDDEMVVTRAGKHPITTGLPPLHLVEEAYKGLEIAAGVTPLLRSDSPNTDGTVAWVSPYQKSRVVAIALGHDRRVHGNAAFQMLIRNAVLWSAGKL